MVENNDRRIQKYLDELNASESSLRTQEGTCREEVELLRHAQKRLSGELLTIDDNLKIISLVLQNGLNEDVLVVFKQEQKMELDRKEDVLNDLKWLDNSLALYEERLDSIVGLLQQLHTYIDRLRMAEGAQNLNMQSLLGVDGEGGLRSLLDQIESMEELENLTKKYL